MSALKRRINVGTDSNEEMKRRIEECRGTFRSNCIGTALRIGGIRKTDRYFSPRNVYKHYLHGFEIITKPRSGCLVSWEIRVQEPEEVMVLHMGVALDESPLIAHRYKRNGQFFESIPFHIIDPEYDLIGAKVVFYLPR